MADHNRVEAVLTIGIDLGDRFSEICVLDGATGEVVERARVRTTRAALQKRFGHLEPARIAIEVGTHSPWAKRVLEDCGHQVVVANAGKVRLIYQSRMKTDRTDAEWLARLARLDERLLAPVHHRSQQSQVDLAVLRSRAVLVAARTKLINHARGVVKAMGTRLKNCSTSSFHRQAAAQIPDALRPALEPVLDMISALTCQIRAVERTLGNITRKRYHTSMQAVSQPTGVGRLTSLCFVLTLEDPCRFRRNRAVGAYLGMTPQRDQSGDGDPQLGITAAGDTQLRSLLVQSAHYILGPFGPDSDLRRWGLELMRRGGKNARKRAAVAVARRLAVLMLSLWKTGEVYEPLRHGHANLSG